FHEWIKLLQLLDIAVEKVVFPEMRTQPCSAGGKRSPGWAIHRSACQPQVCILVEHPTSHSVIHFRNVSSRFDRIGDQLEERLGTFPEIRGVPASRFPLAV